MISNLVYPRAANQLSTFIAAVAGGFVYLVQNAATIDPAANDDTAANADKTPAQVANPLLALMTTVGTDPLTGDAIVYVLSPALTFVSTGAGHAEGVFISDGNGNGVGGFVLPTPVDFTAAGQVLTVDFQIRVGPTGFVLEVPVL